MDNPGLAFRLARRELRGGFGGFKVFVACLALGVAAIAGVGSTSEAVRAGIDRDARLLLGGDVSVRLVHRQAPPAALTALKEAGRFSEIVTMRAMASPGGPNTNQNNSGQNNSGQSNRTLIELKAVDRAWPLFGAVSLRGLTESLTAPLDTVLAERDGVYGVAIDPALGRRLDLEIGDRLHIGDADFEIRAEILREPDRTIRFASFGPRVLTSLAGLERSGLAVRGSLVDFHYRIDLPDSIDPAGWVEEITRDFPDVGWRVRGADQAAPGFERFITRVTQFLTLVGLTALLVGGVGIASAVANFLERRTGTIAILKCLGASGGLIFRLYMIQVAALAGVGIAIGCVIGAGAPFIVSSLLADFTPVALPRQIYWGPLLISALFGGLVTLTFATWPLGRAREVRAAQLFRAIIVPPRNRPRIAYIALTAAAGCGLALLARATSEDANLTLWFILGAIGTMVIFLSTGAGLVALMRRLPSPRHPGLRLAIANLHRPGAPTTGIILSLGLGLTILIAVALVQANLTRQLSEQMPTLAPAYFFIDIQPDQLADFTAIMRATDGVSAIQQTPMVRGRITHIAGVPVADITPDPDVAWAINGDRGLTYVAARPEEAEIVAGEWWPPDYTGPPLLSFDAEVARGVGIGIGDTISLNVLGRPVTATIANLRHIDWSTLGMNFVFVFSPGVLEAAPHSIIATVYADGAQAEDAVHRAVGQNFANVTAIRVKDALENANRILNAVGVAVRVTASITLLAGVLVLAGAAATGRRQRIRDAVILKVLGFTRRRLVGSYLAEYAFLGLLTALIAGVMGSAVAGFIVSNLMRTDFTISVPAIILTLLVSLLFTIGLGLAGAWRALSQKAAPLLRNE